MKTTSRLLRMFRSSTLEHLTQTGVIRRIIREVIILIIIIVTPMARQNIYVPSAIDEEVTPLASAGDLAEIKIR